MDTKGSIKDVRIRIDPSKKMLEFLNSLDYKDDMTEGVLKFIKCDKISDRKAVDQKKVRDVCYMNEKDYENFNKIVKESCKDFDLKHFEDMKNYVEKESVDEYKDIVNKKVEKHAGKDGEDLETEALTSMGKNKKDFETLDKVMNDLQTEAAASVEENEKDLKAETSVEDDSKFLYLEDLEWISLHLDEVRKSGRECVYLHELLESSEVLLPENEVIKRDPVLEARCEKLRLAQLNRDYKKMTRSVDNVRARLPEDTIAYQIKHLNKQLIAVGQFVISVGAGFLFGFMGVELMTGRLDFGFRLLLGVMCALTIALAEIYFLAKKLNEDLTIGEASQIGGPLVFENTKPHND